MFRGPRHGLRAPDEDARRSRLHRCRSRFTRTTSTGPFSSSAPRSNSTPASSTTYSHNRQHTEFAKLIAAATPARLAAQLPSEQSHQFKVVKDLEAHADLVVTIEGNFTGPHTIHANRVYLQQDSTNHAIMSLLFLHLQHQTIPSSTRRHPEEKKWMRRSKAFYENIEALPLNATSIYLGCNVRRHRRDHFRSLRAVAACQRFVRETRPTCDPVVSWRRLPRRRRPGAAGTR